MSQLYSISLFCYFLAMLGIGIYHAGYMKTGSDYLLAGRTMSFWPTAGSVVATSCGAATFIGFVGLGFTSGLNYFFYFIVPVCLFGAAFTLVIGPVLRRFEFYTVADLFVLRFGRTAGLVCGILQVIVAAVPMLALQFLGMGVLLSTYTGLDMNGGIFLGLS